MTYLNGSIESYLKDLAARQPAPGGGSAAALSASIGVALMLMACNYTKGHSKYKASDGIISDIMAKAERFEDALTKLIDMDVKVYEHLSRIKKEAVGDKDAIDAAYRDAVDVPFQICKISADALVLCKDLAGKGNKSLVTDTATAVIMLEGAFFSAKYHVYANLGGVEDIVFIGNVHKVLTPLEEYLPKLKEEILEICEDAIGK